MKTTDSLLDLWTPRNTSIYVLMRRTQKKSHIQRENCRGEDNKNSRFGYRLRAELWRDSNITGSFLYVNMKWFLDLALCSCNVRERRKHVVWEKREKNKKCRLCKWVNAVFSFIFFFYFVFIVVVFALSRSLVAVCTISTNNNNNKSNNDDGNGIQQQQQR